MKTKDEFFEAAGRFRTDLQDDLRARGWSLPGHWWLDHLCYRVETLGRYAEVRDFIGGFADLLAESEVNGRPISTFRLEDPIPGGPENLRIIEVPAPKPGKVVREGFEHAEIVCDESFAELKERFPGADFDDGGLKKTFNRELEIGLGERNLKFHHLSLESVVTLENNTKVFGAIRRSRALELLAIYEPLIVGTYPLSVTTAESDVDIVVAGDEKVVSIVEEAFSPVAGFQLKRGLYRGGPATVAKFSFEGVPFEIFVQALNSVDQDAFRHFQTEERLLALFGEPLLGRIRNLRSQGKKTEPAFAEALGLAGDPYESLLALHAVPTAELRARFRF